MLLCVFLVTIIVAACPLSASNLNQLTCTTYSDKNNNQSTDHQESILGKTCNYQVYDRNLNTNNNPEKDASTQQLENDYEHTKNSVDFYNSATETEPTFSENNPKIEPSPSIQRDEMLLKLSILNQQRQETISAKDALLRKKDKKIAKLKEELAFLRPQLKEQDPIEDPEELKVPNDFEFIPVQIQTLQEKKSTKSVNSLFAISLLCIAINSSLIIGSSLMIGPSLPYTSIPLCLIK